MFIEQLPLVTDGDSPHSTAFLAQIIRGISEAVAVSDYSGAVFWSRKANIYLTLKYNMPLKDRCFLANTLVALASQPEADMSQAHVFASVAVRLLKKKHLDKDLIKQGFAVDWKPLWEQVRRCVFPRGKERVFSADSAYANEIIKLIRECRRFFPASATLEILEEFLPDMNPHNLIHMQRVADVWTRLLPTNQIPTPPKSFQGSSAAVDAPGFYWVPTVFSLWSFVTGNSDLDLYFLGLLARLAEDQSGKPELAGWTDDMISTVFALGLRDLDLPVGSGAGQGGRQSRGSKSKILPYFARFIVYTIYPEQSTATGSYSPPKTSLSQLQTLLQATETYFHPSNYGAWSSKLSNFLHNLVNEFLKRWRQESKPDCTTPTELRLTPEIRKAFVESVHVCAFLAMFSKDPRAVSDANSTIKLLAYLEPEIVLPKVLDRVFPSLENLTETHRTQACLSNLGITILPIVNRSLFPSGARNFVDLLNLALPGIDMNDPMKTSSTLVFISSAFLAVPLANVSNSMVDDDENEDDREVRLSTAALEEWILLFLDRIYVLFENLPQIFGSSNENTMENVIVSMASYALQIIFQQASLELQNIALKSLAKFISTTVIPSATKAVGKIISICGAGSPSLKLRHFLPLTSARIKEELAGHASSKPSLPQSSFPFSFASLSDASLHWNQYAFLNAIVGSGDALLEHKKLVSSTIEDMVLQCRSYRGVKWAAMSIGAVVQSCTAIYPRDFRSVPKSLWEDPAYMSSSYKRWGEFGDSKNFSVDWHIPSDDEITFAVEMTAKYTNMTLEHLSQLMKSSQETASSASDTRREQSFEFSRWIIILRSLSASVSSMVAPWDDMSPVTDDRSFELACPEHVITVHPNCGFLSSTNPHHAQVVQLRHSIGEMLIQLVTHFQTHREDDIGPMKQLVKTISKLVSFRGVKAAALANMINGYKYVKSTSKTIENDKMLPRFLLVKRAQILHLHRRRFAFSHETPHTTQAQQLMTCLFDLSISRYSEIRMLSQAALAHSMVPFETLKKKFFKAYLEKLVSPDSSEHVVKACLHVCNTGIVQDMARRDVDCSYLFIKAICRPFGDKPSIQELVRNIFMSYLGNVSQLSIGLAVPAELKASVRQHTRLDAESLRRGEASLSQSNQYLLKEYSELLTDMLNLIQTPSTHWRARAMAVNLLEATWRPHDPQPLNLTTVILEGVVSSHPTFRDVCLTMLVRILRGLKARARVSGVDRTKAFRTETVRPDTSVIDTDQYLADSVSSKMTDLHDSSIVGWYCWPQKSKFYNQPDASFDQTSGGIEGLPFTDTQSKDSVEAIYTAISTPEFWTKLSSYHALESSKGAEFFNTELFKLVRALACQYEDTFCEHIRPIIEELVRDPKEKSKQRAAAEFLAGLVRGSKNWSTAKLTKLWSWVVPIVSGAIQASTTETARFWIEFLNSISVNRDPRRVLPIIDMIFKWKLDPTSQSFFMESKKLTFMKVIVSHFKWRVSAYFPTLLQDLFSVVRHPYQQVRDVLGVLLNEITQLLWTPSANNVSDVLLWNVQSQGGHRVDVYSANSNFKGVVPVEPHTISKPLFEKLFADMQQWRQVVRTNNVGPSDYGNASKTLLACMVASIAFPCNTAKYTFLDYEVPELFRMIEFEDADLQAAASAMTVLYAHVTFPVRRVPHVIQQVLDILSSEMKWQVKVKVIPVLQVMFFRNMHCLSSEMKLVILETVAALLDDVQVEVRTLAGATLAGLIRCSERDSIQALKVKFEGVLKATKAAKKKSTLPARTDVVATGGSPAIGSTRPHPLIVKRHAAVIGLSSLVLSFPYEVPAWLPEVLITLSSCVSDQAPIGATVSKTFADFRRTHQDNWKEEGMKAFTEDQISILSDLLISSSYYA
ncbi:hypothetical protein HDU80_008541 [Chytriomyces hyalinus]|nr:hypothetical protein HDU80_008541 [Chytriomyces hyalinus]